jgi:hypothetical protein
MSNDELTAKDGWFITKIISFAITFILGLVILGMFGCPRYKVWNQEMEGRAELAKATQNRQIRVQEAMAGFEAAVYKKQEDSTHAIGVAISNGIIGSSLKNNHEYIDWLWVTQVAGKDVDKTVVYVPMDGKLPIQEANRLHPTVDVQIQTDKSSK